MGARQINRAIAKSNRMILFSSTIPKEERYNRNNAKYPIENRISGGVACRLIQYVIKDQTPNEIDRQE